MIEWRYVLAAVLVAVATVAFMVSWMSSKPDFANTAQAQSPKAQWYLVANTDRGTLLAYEVNSLTTCYMIEGYFNSLNCVVHP